jgi:hypothetical protein
LTLDPGSGMGKYLDPGLTSRIRNTGHNSSIFSLAKHRRQRTETLHFLLLTFYSGSENDFRYLVFFSK